MNIFNRLFADRSRRDNSELDIAQALKGAEKRTEKSPEEETQGIAARLLTAGKSLQEIGSESFKLRLGDNPDSIRERVERALLDALRRTPSPELSLQDKMDKLKAESKLPDKDWANLIGRTNSYKLVSSLEGEPLVEILRTFKNPRLVLAEANPARGRKLIIIDEEPSEPMTYDQALQEATYYEHYDQNAIVKTRIPEIPEGATLISKNKDTIRYSLNGQIETLNLNPKLAPELSGIRPILEIKMANAGILKEMAISSENVWTNPPTLEDKGKVKRYYKVLEI